MNLIPQGDDTIEVFKTWDQNPPSGKKIVYALTDNRRGLGIVGYTVKVKLLTIVGEGPVEKIDGYWASDQRGVGDPRWDYVRNPDNSVVAYKANVVQPVTIEPNEAKVAGNVKDALSGDPVQDAFLYAVMLDEDLPDDWPESSFFSQGDGTYEVNAIYAGNCILVCEKPGYALQSCELTLVPGETRNIDFYLNLDYGDW